MKKQLPWLILLAGAGIWFYSRTKKVANTISVSINSIGLDLKAINIFSVPVLFKVTVSNGSMLAATFSSFTGDVLYNGVVIGRINYLQPIQINATSAINLTIPVSVSTTSAGRQLIDILISGIKGVNISINGTLTSAAGNIPINTQYQLK